ncbi:MAG: hypothetical protein A3C38_06090 [Planctomycetes bacterium RIFCSPHIGHO2_02_FULL_50_42]|nr:MAG: hypothetical protein A2060_01215 [Planctomycetes bacterium GWA2_50_13]OHB89639.1 MAG: hypothetical protein A3C38_06090 [Planctomycetes bacterium RIFCSPHIGHO2_02_FULL_50_42]OHB92482.1 MAG: hypothetical protein A3E75_03330 [Planctomycetes bacterium RIFCSPHIGHO2_12_FULL_51_37]OHB94824.1 MAG: hypothetical protein A3I59_01760 [Planctomycetes bacterium RIFCSPLOWO2_02_FULL_50_16]OHC02624.1 MAG: hypothetical protein A3G17_09395 [Planctomycetes bacterium RIFCSPLOWO2_12_FULL_50_35]
MSHTTLQNHSIKQDYIAFLKIFLTTGFLVLILELSQYYDGYRYSSSHLDILRVTAFSWFLILVVVLVLAGVSVVMTTLMRLTALTDTLFKDAVEVVCAALVGLTFVDSIMAGISRFLPPSNPLSHNYWLGSIILLATLAVAIKVYTQFYRALKQWFNNVVALSWIPCLSFSLGILIYIGPGLVTYCITELNGVEANEGKPNVFLITFDSMTTRDMSLYGYHRRTTPYMEEFAKECYVFENMRSICPSTSIALTGVLTGKHPWSQVTKDSSLLPMDLTGALPQKIQSIATELKGSYYTVAVAGTGREIAMETQFDAARNDWVHGKLGSFFYEICGRNFHPLLPPLPWAQLLFSGKTAPLFAGAVQCLGGLKQRPFFMWTHILPPHLPYLPPPPFKGTFLPGEEDLSHPSPTYEESEQPYVDKMRARYDEFILYVDACFHSFLETLKEKGLYDNSLIIVSSDHGESFEKGYLYHGQSPQLYEPELRIPLLIHFPGQSDGSRISVLAGQVDLVPTIIDILGKPIPSWAEGKSLLPYIQGKISNGNKATYSMSGGKLAVLQGNYKFVRLPHGTEKLYNLEKDPNELKDILCEEPDVAARLRELIHNRKKPNKMVEK